MSGAEPGGRRGRRRVVAYSPQDEERRARGEPTEDAVQDAHRRRLDALAQAGETESSASGANDARLLREVPPHWS